MSTTTTTATTITVTKKDGTTKSVESPYTDKEAMMRLYDLTGYELTGPAGRELVWHEPKITSAFARSLVITNEMNGRDLSIKQWAWVHIIVVEAETPREDDREVVSLPQIRSMIDKAAETLKFPKINLTTPEGQRVRLSRSGDGSRRPGVIHITDGRPYGSNTYWGSIDLDGSWTINSNTPDDVRSLLVSFDRDPQAAATAYGRTSGSCSFCSRQLTDGRSVAMGYGPTCADKFGLPWGEDRASSTVEVQP